MKLTKGNVTIICDKNGNAKLNVAGITEKLKLSKDDIKQLISKGWKSEE